MKEVSAGGVIAYQSRGGWMILLMKDMKGNWTFPKGKIEEEENLLDTATREIEEEVGLAGLHYVSELTPASYWYFRRRAIRKKVHYYLFISKTKQKPVVQTEEGISAANWMSLALAKKRVGYPKTNLPLLEEAARALMIGAKR